MSCCSGQSLVAEKGWFSHQVSVGFHYFACLKSYILVHFLQMMKFMFIYAGDFCNRNCITVYFLLLALNWMSAAAAMFCLICGFWKVSSRLQLALAVDYQTVASWLCHLRQSGKHSTICSRHVYESNFYFQFALKVVNPGVVLVLNAENIWSMRPIRPTVDIQSWGTTVV